MILHGDRSQRQSGRLNQVDFSGSPLRGTVVFDVPFPGAYAVDAQAITIDNRGYLIRIENVLPTGFTVNLGTSVITHLDHVSWVAQLETP